LFSSNKLFRSILLLGIWDRIKDETHKQSTIWYRTTLQKLFLREENFDTV
jgi:hypothetical protein